VDERWVDFDGKRLFIRGWGDPEENPILYWHGVHIAGRASMAINEAGPIFAGERGLRVLALDAPGFGNSQALEPSAYHPYALADLVPRLLDALGRNKTDWEAEIEQSWDALLAKVRFRYRRWNHAIESSVRAGRLEQRGRIVPSGDPLVLAAVQRGIALARPSTIRADLGGRRATCAVGRLGRRGRGRSRSILRRGSAGRDLPAWRSRTRRAHRRRTTRDRVRRGLASREGR
jgi:hypothetical protein